MRSLSAVRVEAPEAVQWIVRTLEREGYETWAVGGAVRDAIMGIPSGDWDLATLARPSDVRRIFRRTVPIGIEHGTVGVLARDRVLYEVTTFRKDVVTMGRRAVVEFADALEQDLARRDFTLNAIAWHPLREEWADPFGGIQDLEAGLLRTVGVPEERLAEDFLRILRALRFAGAFSLTIDSDTWDALRRLTTHTAGLSAERVREELWKILTGLRQPSRAMGLYRLTGTLGVLYPEIQKAIETRHAGGDQTSWARALLTVDGLSPSDPELRFAALLWSLGVTERDAVSALCRRLRFSNAAGERVGTLTERGGTLPLESTEVLRRRWLSHAGPHARALLKLSLADARARRGLEGEGVEAVVAAARSIRREARKRPPLTVGDLALDGGDLIALGLRPGPKFATILAGLLDAVLEAPDLNTPETLSRMALELARTSEAR